MKKQIKIILITVLSLAVLTVAFAWFNSAYVRINGEFFSISAEEAVLGGERSPDPELLKRMPNLKMLDVRDIPLQPEQYERLRSALPECRILWQVPVFGGAYDNTETELMAAAVTAQDIENIAFFPELKRVNAAGCPDYDMLLALQEAYPDVEVIYTFSIDGKAVRENAAELVIGGEDASELLDAVAYLPQLTKVDALACSDYDTLHQIKTAYPELELLYTIPVGGENWPSDATQLTLHNADGEELQRMLPYFPALTEVVLTGTAPNNDVMYQMMCQYPNVIFQWNFSVHGVETSSTATELILSDIPMESVEEVENALKYFYDLQRVEMCQCGISNEEMDTLGKRHPETKFVWSFRFGSGYLRTDETALIPFKYGYHFDSPCSDEQTKLLKYCTDLICLDLGHMQMKDLSFLEYMPKLKYLILGDTRAADYSPVGYLTELIYLEVFWSDFKESDVLLKLTKLEDLNCAWAKLEEPEVLYQMTWLKRLWATSAGLSNSEIQELKGVLSDTVIVANGQHPTDGGWRQAQNYYDMRDLLEMPYMK